MRSKAGAEAPEPNEIESLLKKVSGLLDEKQASNIIILDISSLTPMTDFFIIAETDTQLHLNILRAYIADMLEASGIRARNPVREEQTSWALLDYNDFVVHLFLREAREFYGLEKIWNEGKIVQV
jgi:ribosome-associated protein